MSEDGNRPAWKLLNGGGSGGGALVAERPTPTLHVVPRRIVPQVQLGFAFPQVSRQTAVSLAYDGLTGSRFEEILSTYRPATLIDIRLSPSFNSDTLKRETAARLLQTHATTYQHVYALANRFLGESLDPRWSVEKYVAALAGNASVDLVHAAISNGPMILLGSGRPHDGSERAALLDEVARRWPSFRFDLQIGN